MRFPESHAESDDFLLRTFPAWCRCSDRYSILELLSNLHPFIFGGVVEVVDNQDQIMIPIIFDDFIFGQRESFSSGIFIAGAGNLFFGCKLSFVCYTKTSIIPRLTEQPRYFNDFSK